MLTILYAGCTKSAEFIADHFAQFIEHVGPKNVTVVVTDNAANCKAAGEILQVSNVQTHDFAVKCSLRQKREVTTDAEKLAKPMRDTEMVLMMMARSAWGINRMHSAAEHAWLMDACMYS